MSADDSKKYDIISSKFRGSLYCEKKTKSTKGQILVKGFKKRENLQSFNTAVHELAETCEYGDLREELIMDRIIVEIRDQRLSTKLMINEKLTLNECITMVR